MWVGGIYTFVHSYSSLKSSPPENHASKVCSEINLLDYRACFLCLTGAFWKKKKAPPSLLHGMLPWKVSARLRSPCAFLWLSSRCFMRHWLLKADALFEWQHKEQGKIKNQSCVSLFRLRSAAAWLFSYDFGTHSIKSAAAAHKKTSPFDVLLPICEMLPSSSRTCIFWIQRCATQILYTYGIHK